MASIIERMSAGIPRSERGADPPADTGARSGATPTGGGSAMLSAFSTKGAGGALLGGGFGGGGVLGGLLGGGLGGIGGIVDRTPADLPADAAAPPPATTNPNLAAGARANASAELLRNRGLLFDPRLLAVFEDKTATQLAQGALNILNAAEARTLTVARNAVRTKAVQPSGLMRHLERNVAIGEVLNRLAENWSDETVQDFAERAFTMEASDRRAMDAIVSLAILNDPDLERNLRVENTGTPTDGELLENRRIVWQHPAPGTPLEPPYVILVAVEHVDTARAEAAVSDILGQLETVDGFKVPRGAAARMR